MSMSVAYTISTVQTHTHVHAHILVHCKGQWDGLETIQIVNTVHKVGRYFNRIHIN